MATASLDFLQKSKPIRFLVIGIITIILMVGLFGSAYMLLSNEPNGYTYTYGWVFFMSVLGLVVIFGVTIAWLDRGLLGVGEGAFIPALISTALAVCGVATVITVIAYALQYEPSPSTDNWGGELAVVIGGISAIFVWWLLALVCSRSATADRANTRVYAAILARLGELHVRLNCLAKREDDLKDNLKQIAYAEACVHRNFIAKELGVEIPKASDQELELRPSKEGPSKGLPWVLATGYIDLWNRVHRAEEALILIEPIEMVVGEARYDELRITGSGIKGEAGLVGKLQVAYTELSKLACSDSPTDAHSSQSPQEQASAEIEVRDIVRHVRRALNEFRDDSREGLVATRNQLIRTATLCGLTAYVLMVLAIIMQVSLTALITASVFFLVGATVNLFNQLRLASQSDKAIDDYGLSTTRMLHGPLLAGLAAIGGVVIVAFLTDVINSQVPSSAATSTAGTVQTILDLIFDLERYPFGLVLAAVFGLTPELLVRSLEQQAEQLKNNLQTTKLTGQDDVVKIRNDRGATARRV